MKIATSMVLAWLASACTSAPPGSATIELSGESAVAARAPEAPAVLEPAQPPPWAGLATIDSNGGSFRIAWRPTPDPIPRGAPWSIDLWVFAARDPAHPLTGVRLDVDAEMPEHLHGMNRVPRIEPRPDKSFRVEGLLFHMPGRWELYFDVTSGAVTERAQVKVELE